MGASGSFPDCIPNKLIEHFEDFIKFLSGNKLSNATINDDVEELKEKTGKFLNSFDLCIRRSRFNRDISPYFTKIDTAINSFQKCAQYILENHYKPEVKAIQKSFQKDISSFIRQIINLENITTNILQSLENQMYPSYVESFYTELSIFDFALTVESPEIPPYYHMSTLPAYHLHNQLIQSTKRCINVVGPHGTGKTSLIPMFLACKLLTHSTESLSRSSKKKIKIKFVVVVESDPTVIYGIKECYSLLKKNKAIPIHTESDFFDFKADDTGEIEEDDEENDCLLITSSFQKVVEFNKMTMVPVIAILSPLETLQLVRNEKGFAEKSLYVIDDVSQRTIETDVLIQDISKKIDKYDDPNRKGRITLMSTVIDISILNFIGRHENLRYSTELKAPASKETIHCSSIDSIGKGRMLQKMCKFFESWVSDDRYAIGSCVTFVPNDKTGKRILKGIFKYFNKEKSYQVATLHSKIKKGESVEEFNMRLVDEIDNAALERSPDPEAESKGVVVTDNIIFILPIDMTGIVTDETKNLIESRLPLPFIKRKLVRLIVTTNKNEHFLNVPDLTVIFDSGLTEVEYYNIDKASSCYIEEVLPEPFIEERFKLLNDCKDGVHFVFNVDKKERPKNILPPVKRCDMSRSILRLRGIDIKLEGQYNLPNEPNHDILDAGVALLKNIGIIDPESGNLTDIGKVAAKYSIVSPFFALATAKFVENPEFAFIISLVIERSIDLIENSQTKLLYDHFCTESDVVTILESILALNTDGERCLEENEVNYDESGFSIGSLYSIYTSVANTFGKEGSDEGRKAVVSAIQWAKKQPSGTLAMVDKYVNLLDQNNFLNERKGTFQYIVGAGPGCQPMLVYKTNDKLKFEEGKDAHVKFSQRPGWLGLQSPGDIIVLSLQIEESSQLNRGLLFHRDPSQIGVNPGVVSQLETNPSLNSYFFTALFEAYWSGQPTANNFIEIYHTNKPKKEAAFLINICERNEQTYLNYCPRSTAIKDEMNRAIQLLSSLMPFVPRSIVVKSEVPPCVVEVITWGTSSEYESNLYQVEDPNKKNPIAYPITKALLEYAGRKINDLRATHPLIRFSITGESVYYKFNNKRQLETDFSYPNADPNIASVFDPSHSSHLVFIADYNYGDKPGVAQIPWLAAAGAGTGTVESNDTKEIALLADISSKIMSGLGFAERSDDVFYITLDGGFPNAVEGEIPKSIQARVDYCEAEQGAIKKGVDQLVNQFTKLFSKNLDLTNQVELKVLGSTNQCTRYTNDAEKQNLINQVNATLSAQLHLGKDDIESIFLGPSMICISISNLPPNLTTHPKSKDESNDDYQPCQADITIGNILRSISIPVTTVVHEPTINVTVFHLRRLCLNRDEFEKGIQNVSDQFGFLLATKSDYFEEDTPGILGKMSVGLIGKSTCAAFATCISKEFPIVSGCDDLGMTRTMTTMTTMRTLRDLDPRLGGIPKVNPYSQKAMRVPLSEIEAIKDLFKHKEGYKYDEKYRVIIFPFDDEEEVKKKMAEMRSEKLEVACFMGCGLDEPDLLPQYLYVNEKDGTIKPFGVCKGCVLSIFENDDDIQQIFNPVTQMIDQNKLSNIPEPLKAFTLIDTDADPDGLFWPQVPFGQLIWVLMSDPTNTLPPYIKAWFTIIVEFTIEYSRNFIFCPNHPNIPLPLPEPGKKAKCPLCDMMFCSDCLNWHRLDDVCTGFDPGVKRCPWCHVPGEKVSGCNRITCPRCGNSWCYECLAGFKTAQECYNHMAAVGH